MQNQMFSPFVSWRYKMQLTARLILARLIFARVMK